MRLGDLTVAEVAARLGGAGIALDFGPVRARVRSTERSFASAIREVYREFADAPGRGFFDVTATIRSAAGLRRFIRRQVQFFVDGEAPFDPFPADTHLPLLEWGLNWCIASRCNNMLLLHAGAVERNGCAILLPAQPGSGKSTLTAALARSGFRLLSDEFGVVDLQNGAIRPMVRPVALKNESIDVIRAFAPDACIGPSFPKTRKGTVAHLAPDRASVDRRKWPARATLVVFPRYVAGEALSIEPMEKSRAFVKLAGNAFNYEVLGPLGFHAARRLVQSCACFRIRYGDLRGAVAAISQLLEESDAAGSPMAPQGAAA